MPSHVVNLPLLDLEPVDEPLAQVGVHVGADLEPHDLSEAAPAQLVLDGTQQVVGLVGHREVGVAGDAEHRVRDDLHAGEQLVEVARDHRLERDERVLADRHEARQHLLRHLHAGERLVARRPDRAPRRRGSKTGSRCTGTAARGRRRAGLGRGRSGRGTRGRRPRARRCRTPRRSRSGCRAPRAAAGRRSSHSWMWRTPCGGHHLRHPLDRLLRTEPVGPARVDPRVDLVVRVRPRAP